jgi:DNA modification methylase
MQARSKTPYKLPGKTIYYFEHMYWCRYVQEGVKKDIDLGYRRQKQSKEIIDKIKEYLLKTSGENDIIISIDSNSDEIVIACEQTHRVCYSLEMDAQYCDVILSRWEQFTGQTAQRIN